MRLSRFILAVSCSSLLICLCALAFNASNRANTQPFNSATQINSEVAQAQQKTGIVARIDKTAQQITVLINSKNNGNGSGAIVAREGNTYYVLTASHVIQNPDAYTLVTSDGEQYPLDVSQTKVLKGIDLAVVEFTSQKTYAIATLARYKLSDSFWVFVSGFP
jgi:S1-C subfamily serine protease